MNMFEDCFEQQCGYVDRYLQLVRMLYPWKFGWVLDRLDDWSTYIPLIPTFLAQVLSHTHHTSRLRAPPLCRSLRSYDDYFQVWFDFSVIVAATVYFTAGEVYRSAHFLFLAHISATLHCALSIVHCASPWPAAEVVFSSASFLPIFSPTMTHEYYLLYLPVSLFDWVLYC